MKTRIVNGLILLISYVALIGFCIWSIEELARRPLG